MLHGMQRGTAHKSTGPPRGGSDLPLLDITERNARRPELRSLVSGRREILWVCSHGVRAKHGINGLELSVVSLPIASPS